MSKVHPFEKKEEANEILEDFANICDDLGVGYCLIGGICLGFYRDGGYIPTDDDIDVWVDCETTETEKYIIMMEELVKLKFIPHQPPPDIRFIHFFRDGILLDIWSISRPPQGTNIYLGPFDEIIYNGRAYNLPQPIEKYLERAYGEDWRISKER